MKAEAGGSGPRVSVVVRCYNEVAHIGRLLEGIGEQTVSDVEIIVVDSGSTDGTLDVVEHYPARVVRISPEEFSFGRSLNLGCSVSRGEFLVFASAHVYPIYDDWLERLLAPFGDSDVALSYGRQRGGPETKYSEHQVFAKWFPEKINYSQETPFCNNANAAIRRSVWQTLPYDETLTGLEDVDWAQRAMEQGHTIAYAGDAEVAHIHEEAPRATYNRYRREAIAMKRIFPEEGLSFIDFLRLYVGNVLSDSYHAWRDGVFPRVIPSIVSFRLMQFLGSYHGFSQRGPVTSKLKRRFYYPNGRRRSVASTAAGRRPIEYADRPAEEAPWRT